MIRTMRQVLSSIVLGILAGFATGAESGGAVPLNIDEPALYKALVQFTQQAGLELIFQEPERAENLKAPRLSGTYTPKEALERLLKDSGFRYEFMGPKAVAIFGKEEGPRAGMSDPGHAMRVAGSEADASSDHGQANSQDAGTPKLEEVVVTAQKRKERLQDVPISITALSGRDLDKSSGGVIDALAQVPGVSMVGGSNFSGNNLFSVRGVVTGAAQFTGSSTTGYYIDSVPFGFVRNAQVPDVNSFDLQQVEVLRGPQGTLYGASSLNGVVRILTHDADLDALDFKSRATLSDTQGGGWNYRGDAALNVPLVPGKLAMRAVLGYENISGWIDRPVSALPNSPLVKDSNDNRLCNARFKLNAQPTDNLSFGLSAWFSRLNSGAPSAGDLNDFFGGHNDQSGSTDFNTYGFKVGYELPGVSLSSMTSYIDYRNLTKIDFSYFPTFPDFEIDDTLNTTMSSRALSEELLARSTLSGSWRWTAGAFYRDTDEKTIQELLGSVSPDVNDLSTSFAVFGELTRIFNDGRFEVTGGLRYFKDQVRMNESPDTDPSQANDPLLRLKSNFHAVTPRVVLTWHPMSRAMLYASYSEGFRSGFFNGPNVYSNARTLGADLPSIKPDSLNNYEVGAKGGSANGRISYDAAVYYQDWEHIATGAAAITVNGQQFPFGFLANGPSAGGMGVDLATSFRPWRRLNLGVSFSWNDLAYDATTLNPITNEIITPKGGRLLGSAEYTAGASVEYRLPLGGSGLEGGFSASANYSSRRPMTIDIVSDSVVDTKVAFSIEAADRWMTSLFVDNVANGRKDFNKDYLLGIFDQRQRPRTIGLQFEYRMGVR